jgi:hypothetical protein
MPWGASLFLDGLVSQDADAEWVAEQFLPQGNANIFRSFQTKRRPRISPEAPSLGLSVDAPDLVDGHGASLPGLLVVRPCTE